MPLPASDDFNRVDNDSLGANWDEREGTGPADIRILTNAVRLQHTFDSARWVADAFANDQYGDALLVDTNSGVDSINAGLGIRLNLNIGVWRGYAFVERSIAGVQHRSLFRRDDGATVLLADELGNFPIGINHRITAIGNVIRGYQFIAGAWLLRLTAVDATYPSGAPGFVSLGGTATIFQRWDNWVGNSGDPFAVAPKGKRNRMGFMISTGRRVRRLRAYA